MRFKKKDIMEIAKENLPSKEDVANTTAELKKMGGVLKDISNLSKDNNEIVLPFLTITKESKKVVKTIKVEQLR